MITNIMYNAHTEPIMKNLQILKLEDMFRLNLLKWYYKYCNNKLPVFFLNFKIQKLSDIHHHNTRNKFVIPHNHLRLKSSRYCLRNHIAVVLNSFNADILDKVNTHSYQGYQNISKQPFFLNGYTFKQKFETYQKFYFIFLKGYIGGLCRILTFLPY